MTVISTWALNILNNLCAEGKIQTCGLKGYQQHGRGAVSLDLSLKTHYLQYLSIAKLKCSNLEPERLEPLLQTVNTYDPTAQAVVVITVHLEDNWFEVITCLVG